MRAWIHLLLAFSLSITASISAAREPMPEDTGSVSKTISQAMTHHAMMDQVSENPDSSGGAHHHQACDKCPPVFTGDPGHRDATIHRIDYILDPGYRILQSLHGVRSSDWLMIAPARAPPSGLISHQSLL